MKIGLITYPLNNNYGNLLQAYALMTTLKRMGHDVWFIDMQVCPPRGFLYFLRKIKRKYFLKQKNVIINSREETNYLRLNKIITQQYAQPFVDKYLNPKISPIYTSDELVYVINKIAFDVFISGSDQIWRPQMMRKLLKVTYFDFLHRRKEKKITYAASFGTSEWEYSSSLTKECAELAKQINAISVREKSGVELCKKHLGVNAQWVLDPCLLLDKEDYIRLVEDAKIEKRTGDLFCYILDETEDKEDLILRVSEELSLIPFHIRLKLREDESFKSVEVWLKAFFEATFVITDSFHGAVFSILLNKPFIAYGNIQRGMDRFVSLLENFELKDRLLYAANQFTPNLVQSTIDWDKINKIKSEKRKQSFQFLLDNLLGT